MARAPGALHRVMARRMGKPEKPVPRIVGCLARTVSERQGRPDVLPEKPRRHGARHEAIRPGRVQRRRKMPGRFLRRHAHVLPHGQRGFHGRTPATAHRPSGERRALHPDARYHPEPRNETPNHGAAGMGDQRGGQFGCQSQLCPFHRGAGVRAGPDSGRLVVRPSPNAHPRRRPCAGTQPAAIRGPGGPRAGLGGPSVPAGVMGHRRGRSQL